MVIHAVPNSKFDEYILMEEFYFFITGFTAKPSKPSNTRIFSFQIEVSWSKMYVSNQFLFIKSKWVSNRLGDYDVFLG